MKFQDLLDRISKLDASIPADGMVVPAPELIAFNVRCVRSMRQLKKSTLADLAGVSLSTIERVERAEKVSNDCLEKIAIALGQDRGYYTARAGVSPMRRRPTRCMNVTANLKP